MYLHTLHQHPHNADSYELPSQCVGNHSGSSPALCTAGCPTRSVVLMNPRQIGSLEQQSLCRRNRAGGRQLLRLPRPRNHHIQCLERWGGGGGGREGGREGLSSNFWYLMNNSYILTPLSVVVDFYSPFH